MATIFSSANEEKAFSNLEKFSFENSFKEISKFLDIPVGTLTWSYQEARKKLINKLKGIYIDERN